MTSDIDFFSVFILLHSKGASRNDATESTYSVRHDALERADIEHMYSYFYTNSQKISGSRTAKCLIFLDQPVTKFDGLLCAAGHVACCGVEQNVI